MTDEYMDNIKKEWPEEFLVPIADAELSDIDIIGSPLVTQVEHVGQSSWTKKKKNKEEVQNIEIDEEKNAYEENGQEGGDEGEKKG
jgi:hypothetical protein